MEDFRFVETLEDTLVGWAESITSALPSVALAIVVLVAFFFAARGVRRVAEGALNRLNLHSAAAKLLTRMAAAAVMIAGLFVALDVLDLRQAAMSLVAGAGVLGIALGFAFQDMTASLVSGLVLSFRKPFVIGDTIETSGHTGIVRELRLRTTELETFDGASVDIPNRLIFSNTLVNFTRTPERRVDVSVGVSYAEDLPEVEALVRQALDGVAHRDEARELQVHFVGFGDSSIDLVARFWIHPASQAAFFEARSDAIVRIKRTFDDAEVSIPFPIRTVDFGIKGGDHLGEVLDSHARALGADARH